VGVDKSALTTCKGFKKMLGDHGAVVPSQSLNSGIRLCCDGGTEFQGVFRDMMDRAGITISKSTVYKKASGKQGIAENSNRRAQEQMRVFLNTAKPSFERFGMDERDCWDFAIEHAALVDRALHRVEAGIMTYAQLVRELHAPWGQTGMVSVLAGSPERKGESKQLQTRAVPGIFLGVHDHKSVMLLKGGKIVETTDVVFDGEFAIATGDNGHGHAELSALDDIEVQAARDEGMLGVSASDTARTLNDKNGETLNTGDNVQTEFTDGAGIIAGVITNINEDTNQVTIDYEDGDTCVHDYDDAADGMTRCFTNTPMDLGKGFRVPKQQIAELKPNPQLTPMQVDLDLKPGRYDNEEVMNAVIHAFTTARTHGKKHLTHSSVAKYITEDGDINANLLDGTWELPDLGDQHTVK
jgi:hypothetical protein